jgi:hypothetical protein
MNNGDMPATATMTYHRIGNASASVTEHTGLTKRETMAMHFTAALLTATDKDGDWTGTNVGAAGAGLMEADALLKALEES